MTSWKKKYIACLFVFALGAGIVAFSSCGDSDATQSSFSSENIQSSIVEQSNAWESSVSEEAVSSEESVSEESIASSEEVESVEESISSSEEIESVEESVVSSEEVESSEENKEQYKFNDFADDEKALFTRYVGEVIPFLPNNEYYVEGYYDVNDYENGMCFYTVCAQQTDFEEYVAKYLLCGYTFIETYQDEANDLWYCYEKNDIVVDMCRYYDAGEYWIIVYVYSDLSDGDDSEDWWEDESSDWWEDSSEQTPTDVNVITNAGKGLPEAADGVYEVDFTKATPVKNVTQQGYYLDGCPTTGKVSVLVIPVEFSDVTAASKGYSLDKLNTVFNGAAGSTDYYSVKEYYSISSYGALDLSFVIADGWFRPQYTSEYYAKQTTVEDGYEYFIGDQIILDEALAKLSKTMDLSAFDSDNNGVIDAVVMVNTMDIDGETDFTWAYRYWNYYTDDEGDYYEYDGVSANDYLWASYQFIYEGYDAAGNVDYQDTSVINPYTYIHEFGHVLGADDYYDTAYVGNPLGGYDIMDAMLGDHNAYTKFNYGWLTSSRLIVAEESVTVELQDFSKNGDTLIIANNWDEKLGAYQEYFLLVYYTESPLNSGDGGYFEQSGIVVYHINASLYSEVYNDETYYDVYNNNTDVSDENGYGTKDNLIEFVTTAYGDYVYEEGDVLSATTKDDAGNYVAYVFRVDELTGEKATLTFTKNK